MHRCGSSLVSNRKCASCTYNVLLAIATNIAVLLMTAFVLQRHICVAKYD